MNDMNDLPRITSAAELLTAYAAGRRDFREAYLRGADLTMADTSAIRDDLYAALAYAPHEVPALLATLEAGKIDGSTYNGACSCACLAGTIARLTDDALYRSDSLASGDTLACGLLLDADSPRERWFLAIQPGDTPENSPVAALTAQWIEAWLASHPEATATASE